MADVHLAVTRRVRPGHESEFERRLETFVRQSMDCQGMSGVHVLRPPQHSASREYGILRSFRSQDDADRFYESDLFHGWLQSIEDLTDGPPEYRKLGGLEAFFRDGRGPLPPRWKMALVTFVGVFPTVLLWSNLLPRLLTGLPWLIVAALVNAMVVVTLTWGVMPMLTKWFHAWLHGPSD